MVSRRRDEPDKAPRGRPGWGAGHRSRRDRAETTRRGPAHGDTPPADPPPADPSSAGGPSADPPSAGDPGGGEETHRAEHRFEQPESDEQSATGEPHRGTAPPRKLTVTRVAAWRSRDLTQRAMRRFFSAAQANGAEQSGLAKFTYVVMFNYTLDAVMAVALANTLFFSAATGESKGKVALYLLITVAPFAVIAPVIGPALDRLQQGRRLALAASFAARVLLAAVMAVNFDTWLLYPAALGSMVLSKSFNVLKAAMTPRVLPAEITLTKANSRLTTFGMAAGGVFGAVASGFAALLGSEGALWFMAAMAAVGIRLSLRIPAWVESTEGEVPATLAANPGRTRRSPMSPHVVVALYGNGGIRLLTGFLTLFIAFVIKHNTTHEPFMQLLLLGLVGGAAGIGSFLGNAVGAQRHFGKPDRVIIGSLSSALAATVCAAVLAGLPLAIVVGLVGASASALAKVCLDAVVQREMAEESRASAFGRSETVLQLSWVIGGALGVLLPPVYWAGFTIMGVLLAAVLALTIAAGRGGYPVLLRSRTRTATAPSGTASPEPGAEDLRPRS